MHSNMATIHSERNCSMIRIAKC